MRPEARTSPYAIWVYAQALLADDDHSLPVLPGGTLRLDGIEQLSLSGEAGELSAKTYALSGIDLNPTYFVLDENDAFVALVN